MKIYKECIWQLWTVYSISSVSFSGFDVDNLIVGCSYLLLKVT